MACVHNIVNMVQNKHEILYRNTILLILKIDTYTVNVRVYYIPNIKYVFII